VDFVIPLGKMGEALSELLLKGNRRK
jgi:hypothetical protein